MSELTQLIDKEIPDARQSLQENFSNLERLAQYCQENYIKAPDKRQALEETKNFTTHSLACVAYQINNLATNFLKLLDLQQNQMTEMESNVNHLAQTVQIHKEKVARREIGVLTTNRSITRPLGVKNGIIFPEHGERPTKYQRKGIDYGELDNVGHGVKSQSAVSANQKSRTSSVGSHDSQGSGKIPAPNQRPPSPPQQMKQQMNRQSSQQQQPQGPYRTPAPMVAPPTVPGQYAGMQQQRVSGYAPGMPPPLGMSQIQQRPGGMGGMGQPPVGMARPISQTSGPPSPGIMMDMQGPPRYRASHMPHQTSIDNLPPPPLSPADTDDRSSRTLSIDEASPPPPPPPQFDDEDELPIQHQEEDPYAATEQLMLAKTDWIPSTYLEKVIAIYDYQADKEDELSFAENSVIYVIKKNDDGWWEGVLNNETGLFPGNYVEPCI